jgi:hypothetical protein
VLTCWQSEIFFVRCTIPCSLVDEYSWYFADLGKKSLTAYGGRKKGKGQAD